MGSDKNPFDILGITLDAEREVIDAAYRAKARLYHPDRNLESSPHELNQKMAGINWAKEELDHDLDGWKQRVKSRVRNTDTSATQPSSAYVIAFAEVQPQVLNLAGRRGSTARFSVRAVGIDSQDIRARFKEGLIDVNRVQNIGQSVEFQVTVMEDFPSDMSDNAVEAIEIKLQDKTINTVFASIAPINESILAQQYGAKIAPPRHASLDARIAFGRHRGRTFREIALEDPGYLSWMLREGAGSRIEQECARLGLNLSGGIPLQRQNTARRASPIHTSHRPVPSKTLSVSTEQRSLIGTLKALFSPRERKS